MKEKLRKLLLLISIVVFLVSGGMIAKYYYDSWKTDKEFKKLEEKAEYSLKTLKEENSDIYGWIKIADTKISYPVMFTPKSPEFYLRRNFDKEYSEAGTPFIDGYQDLQNSKHMVIYAHHMKDGSMFHDLINYDDPKYAKEHNIIELETVDGVKKKYRVFAHGKTNAAQEGFNVYDYINIFNEAQLSTFLNGIKAMSSYDFSNTPTINDNILTLSTCSYHEEDGRYIISAIEVKE